MVRWLLNRWLGVRDTRAFLNWAELRYPEHMGVAVRIPTALWTSRPDLRNAVGALQDEMPSVQVVTVASVSLWARVAKDRRSGVIPAEIPGVSPRPSHL